MYWRTRGKQNTDLVGKGGSWIKRKLKKTNMRLWRCGWTAVQDHNAQRRRSFLKLRVKEDVHSHCLICFQKHNFTTSFELAARLLWHQQTQPGITSGIARLPCALAQGMKMWPGHPIHSAQIFSPLCNLGPPSDPRAPVQLHRLHAPCRCHGATLNVM